MYTVKVQFKSNVINKSFVKTYIVESEQDLNNTVAHEECALNATCMKTKWYY